MVRERKEIKKKKERACGEKDKKRGRKAGIEMRKRGGKSGETAEIEVCVTNSRNGNKMHVEGTDEREKKGKVRGGG